MKTVLILGAGLVARPTVRYLLDLPDVYVIVADYVVEKARVLVSGHPQGEARALDVTDAAALRALVSGPAIDLVISLLPYVYHVQVAELCLEFGKDMATTSYVSPAMRALDARAREAGVTFLNEMGVDPGIDHMSAMRVIRRVQADGGEITSFRSWCGGLPSPEANTNPLGYKFSWSPRGALLAGRNPAHYYEDGIEVNIPGAELFAHYRPVAVAGLDGDLEGYPNRDAVPYAERYGIPSSAHTIFRGTLRYPGWCDTLKALVDLGLLDVEEKDWGTLTFAQYLGQLIGGDHSDDLRQAVADVLNCPVDSPLLDKLAWLGLFSDDPLPLQHGAPLRRSAALCSSAPIDILTAQMLSKMVYAEGERDMLVMQHEFVAVYPDCTEAITSTLLDFGIPDGDTSMARTVGLPVAIGAKLLLTSQIARKGVIIPVTPDIYEPVIAELATMGISFSENVRRMASGK